MSTSVELTKSGDGVRNCQYYVQSQFPGRYCCMVHQVKVELDQQKVLFFPEK